MAWKECVLNEHNTLVLAGLGQSSRIRLGRRQLSSRGRIDKVAMNQLWHSLRFLLESYLRARLADGWHRARPRSKLNEYSIHTQHTVQHISIVVCRRLVQARVGVTGACLSPRPCSVAMPCRTRLSSLLVEHWPKQGPGPRMF